MLQCCLHQGWRSESLKADKNLQQLLENPSKRSCSVSMEDSEKSTLVDLTTNFFQHLSNEVLLETKNWSMLTPNLRETVHASPLVIGSRYTWHGSPSRTHIFK